MTNELPAKIYKRIKCLCGEGDRCLELNNFEGALEKYRKAWELVPDDKIDWEASTWILASAGEVYFRQQRHVEALDRFLRAIQCPAGPGNPFIHLRLGQLHFELGD